MFPRRGFTKWKHHCVDIWYGYVSGYWRCSSSVGIPMLSNMVSEPVWRPVPVVDRDREAEFPHLHFMVFSYISGWEYCSIASRALVSFRNTFRFTRKGFHLPKIRPLQSDPERNFFLVWKEFFWSMLSKAVFNNNNNNNNNPNPPSEHYNMFC